MDTTSANSKSDKRYGFPKEARLKQKSDFDRVFSEGTKGVSDALVIYTRGNREGRNRIGLAVGRKLGKAVRRNRIRRLIKEAFRLENPTLPQGFDLVCIPRGGGFPAKTHQLIPLFRYAFLKAVSRWEKGGKRR